MYSAKLCILFAAETETIEKNLQEHVRSFVLQTFRYQEKMVQQSFQQNIFFQTMSKPSVLLSNFLQASVASIFSHEHLTNLEAVSYLHPPVPPPPTQKQEHHPGQTALASTACSCSNAGEPPPGENRILS